MLIFQADSEQKFGPGGRKAPDASRPGNRGSWPLGWPPARQLLQESGPAQGFAPRQILVPTAFGLDSHLRRSWRRTPSFDLASAPPWPTFGSGAVAGIFLELRRCAILRELAVRFGLADDLRLFSQEFEPVFGLPKCQVLNWLERNPHLRPQYEEALRQRVALLNVAPDFSSCQPPPKEEPERQREGKP